MELITPSIGMIFWTSVTFLTLLIILRSFAWKPILKIVNDRQENIKKSIESAERAREEMEILKADNDKILREARLEREVILKETRELRDMIIAKAKENAHKEGAKELDIARQTIYQEKLTAKIELKNELATLSIGIAERVLKEELKDKSKQESLVASLVEDIKLN